MTPSCWYVKNNSGIVGPLSDEELVHGIKSGRFTWIDMAYGGGENRWRALIEIESLSGLRHPYVKADSTLWVVHHRDSRKNGDETRRAIYSGPFDTQTVIAKIKAGEISYSDEICVYGGEAWRRVGDCEEFAPPAPKPDFVIPETVDFLEVPQVTVAPEEAVANVVRMEPRVPARPVIVEEAPPPEAEGDDLVGTPEWMKFIGSLVFVLLGPIYAAHAASVLKIVPLKLDSAPTLVFESDAKKSEVIEVKIIGENGEILGLPSFRYKTQLQRGSGELPALNLASLNLPRGTYKVEAKVGGIQTSKSIFIGVKDEKFAELLEEHKKSMAAETQSEKRTLFYSARTHESLAAELKAQVAALKGKRSNWSRFYSTWKTRLNAARKEILKLSERAKKENAVAFPELIADLKAASDQLEKYGQELDSALKGGRQPASFAPPGFIGNFTNLKLEAGRL